MPLYKDKLENIKEEEEKDEVKTETKSISKKDDGNAKILNDYVESK